MAADRRPSSAGPGPGRADDRPTTGTPVVDLEAMVGLARTGRCCPEPDAQVPDAGVGLTELAARLTLCFK